MKRGERRGKAAKKRGIDIVKKDVSKIEKKAEREIKFLLSPKEFHIISFVISLVVLGMVFRSSAIIFYTIASVLVLLFVHFLREHDHKAHDVLTVLGVFILPATLALILFNDLFSLLLFTLYIFSLVVAAMVYYHHAMRHPFMSVMWNMVYSHVVSFTLAGLTALLLIRWLPKIYFSSSMIIIAFVLPVIFVYFFFTKFLYVYFFDKKHWLFDIVKALKHAILFAFAFILILLLAFAAFSTYMFTSQLAEYDRTLTTFLDDAYALESSIDGLPSQVADLEVMADLSSSVEDIKLGLIVEKNRVDSEDASLTSIMTDNHFTVTAENSYSSLLFMLQDVYMIGMKDNIVRKHATITNILDNNLTFADGSTDMKTRLHFLKSKVDDSYGVYHLDASASETLAALSNPSTSYGVFEDSGYNFIFSTYAGVSVYDHDDLAMTSYYGLLKRSIAFREMAALTIKVVMLLDREAFHPSLLELMYLNRNINESSMSKLIRYELLYSHMVARADMGSADRFWTKGMRM